MSRAPFSSRSRTAAVAAAVAMAGCPATTSSSGPSGANPTDPVVVPSTQPTLATEIGTGEDAFQALPDGGPVTLVYGSQGGQHIWTAVRVRGVAADAGLFANVSVSSDATPLGPESGWAGPWTAVSGDTLELAGMRAYLREPISGKDVILHVEVVAKDGRHGADSRTVHVP